MFKKEFNLTDKKKILTTKPPKYTRKFAQNRPNALIAKKSRHFPAK